MFGSCSGVGGLGAPLALSMSRFTLVFVDGVEHDHVEDLLADGALHVLHFTVFAILSEFCQNIDHQVPFLNLSKFVVVVNLLGQLVEFAHHDWEVTSRVHELLDYKLEFPLHQQLLRQDFRVQILEGRRLVEKLAIAEDLAVFGVCSGR